MALTSAWYNMYQSLNWLLSVSVVRAGLGFWLTISTAQHNAWHRGDTQYINTCWVNVYQKRVTLFSSFWAMFYSSDILATGLEPVETPGLAAPHSSCLLAQHFPLPSRALASRSVVNPGGATTDQCSWWWQILTPLLWHREEVLRCRMEPQFPAVVTSSIAHHVLAFFPSHPLSPLPYASPRIRSRNDLQVSSFFLSLQGGSRDGKELRLN